MMNDVSTMVENESARRWEELNRPVYSEVDMRKFRSAYPYLRDAIIKMDSAYDEACSAFDKIADTVGADRLDSLLNDFDKLISDMQTMRDAFQKGGC